MDRAPCRDWDYRRLIMLVGRVVPGPFAMSDASDVGGSAGGRGRARASRRGYDEGEGEARLINKVRSGGRCRMPGCLDAWMPNA